MRTCWMLLFILPGMWYGKNATVPRFSKLYYPKKEYEHTELVLYTPSVMVVIKMMS